MQLVETRPPPLYKKSSTKFKWNDPNKKALVKLEVNATNLDRSKTWLVFTCTPKFKIQNLLIMAVINRVITTPRIIVIYLCKCRIKKIEGFMV